MRERNVRGPALPGSSLDPWAGPLHSPPWCHSCSRPLLPSTWIRCRRWGSLSTSLRRKSTMSWEGEGRGGWCWGELGKTARGLAGPLHRDNHKSATQPGERCWLTSPPGTPEHTAPSFHSVSPHYWPAFPGVECGIRPGLLYHPGSPPLDLPLGQPH